MSISGECSVSQLLRDVLYSERLQRSVKWREGPDRCATFIQSRPHPSNCSKQIVRNASQWHWQVQQSSLPCHVHQLPPHVLDDLSQYLRWYCQWSGVERFFETKMKHKSNITLYIVILNIYQHFFNCKSCYNLNESTFWLYYIIIYMFQFLRTKYTSTSPSWVTIDICCQSSDWAVLLPPSVPLAFPQVATLPSCRTVTKANLLE